MGRLTSLLGLLLILALALLLSENRRRISLRIVVTGLLLQAVAAGMLLAVPQMVMFLEVVARGINRLILFARDGGRFVFGSSAVEPDGPLGFVFAVQVLPAIIFFSALMAVLYHLGVMQRVVWALAWLLQRSLGISGPEALVTTANVFVGQTEAPLCVKPYIASMSRSQIMVLMTAGFATVAGSTLVAYVLLLGGDASMRILFTRHLLTASLMSAPAALVMAKMMTPEVDRPVTGEARVPSQEVTTQNVLDAVAVGTADGLRLALNVGAMLIAFVALLAMIDWPLTILSEWPPVRAWREQLHLPSLNVQNLLGLMLAPLSLAMGVPWRESMAFGGLLGQKLVATEFIAYGTLAELLRSGEVSLRTAQIASYALCGFANFASIGIQIGALTALAPNQKRLVVSLALRAMIGGALASCMTACMAALFLV